ncbi:MAG TPA: hypothetical protein DEQ32_05365, partial [Gammaproteobacteria bacterium]|nr:hypothetical protein [Gammaproteobacteria bacterium]
HLKTVSFLSAEMSDMLRSKRILLCSVIWVGTLSHISQGRALVRGCKLYLSDLSRKLNFLVTTVMKNNL